VPAELGLRHHEIELVGRVAAGHDQRQILHVQREVLELQALGEHAPKPAYFVGDEVAILLGHTVGCLLAGLIDRVVDVQAGLPGELGGALVGALELGRAPFGLDEGFGLERLVQRVDFEDLGEADADVDVVGTRVGLQAFENGVH